MRRVMLGGFVALALVAGACSDGDESKAEEESGEEESSGGGGSGSRQEYVDALVPGLAVLGTSDEESLCMAEAVVDTVGTERLDEVTSPEDLASTGTFDPSALNVDASEGEELYEALDGCTDLLEILVSAGGPTETVDCLRENIDEETLKAVMIATFTGETEGMADAQTKLTEAYTTCSPTGSLPTPTTVATG